MKNHAGGQMWPSEGTTEQLYSWGNIGLIIGLVIGVVSTVLVVWMGHNRDSYLEQKLATTNRQTAELEAQNLEIKQKMAWRSLGGDNRKTFVNSVRAAGRQVTIVELQDGESWNYAEQIFSAFKEAGWTTNKNYRQIYDSGGVPQGVVCRIAPNPDSAVQSAMKALETAGANPETRKETHLRPDFLEITVGLKPIG